MANNKLIQGAVWLLKKWPTNTKLEGKRRKQQVQFKNTKNAKHHVRSLVAKIKDGTYVLKEETKLFRKEQFWHRFQIKKKNGLTD